MYVCVFVYTMADSFFWLQANRCHFCLELILDIIMFSFSRGLRLSVCLSVSVCLVLYGKGKDASDGHAKKYVKSSAEGAQKTLALNFPRVAWDFCSGFGGKKKNPGN